MTLLNVFSAGSRTRAVDVRGDRSVTLIVFILLGLVFAPMIGLHFAFAAVDPGAAAPTSAVIVDDGGSPAKVPGR
jgi:hypothetical protein